VNLEEGLRRFVEWFREFGDRYQPGSQGKCA